MTIDIICPVYNGENYIENLHSSLLKQKNVDVRNIKYILTESSDNSEAILKKLGLCYEKISRQEFSHSLVREKAALESESDIVVFITMDIIIENDDWLYNLTKDIDNEIAACYSRQLPKDNCIEKYTRQVNYPAVSRITSKDDIESLGLKAFFFSDAASAVNRKIFADLNGYDNKNLPTNEDMYFAHKLITSGYKIKYCADSVVIHSHNFSLCEVYQRYKLTGQFFKENSFLDEYGTTGAGGSLAKAVLKSAIKDFNLKVLVRYPFDMAARFFGMRAGKR